MLASVWSGPVQRTSASQGRILRVLCGYFEHQKAGTVRRMCGGAAQDHHGHSPRVEVDLLASACCVAGRFERGYKHLPSAEVDGLRG